MNKSEDNEENISNMKETKILTVMNANKKMSCFVVKHTTKLQKLVDENVTFRIETMTHWLLHKFGTWLRIGTVKCNISVQIFSLICDKNISMIETNLVDHFLLKNDSDIVFNEKLMCIFWSILIQRWKKTSIGMDENDIQITKLWIWRNFSSEFSASDSTTNDQDRGPFFLSCKPKTKQVIISLENGLYDINTRIKKKIQIDEVYFSIIRILWQFRIVCDELQTKTLL